MGCFGDMTPTKQVDSSSTTSPPAWVQQAGQENYNLARSVLDKGFVPYTGEMVAPLSQNERTAGDLVARTAATPNPYAGATEGAINKYGAAPGYNFDWSTIVDPNSKLGSVQSYMNPYLDAVLAPQMRQIGISGAQARNSINSNATRSGAFGDARHGVVEGQQRKDQALLEGDTTGKAYSDAFGSAMANRQQDMSRLLSTEQAQAGEDKATLERGRTAGQDLTNLDKYGVSRALGLSSALGTSGANERGVAQATDEAKQGEFMRQQGFTDNQIAFLTSVLKGTPTAQTTTGSQTTSQPDNSGWQGIGTLASMLFL